jgi:hypothetical protein
LTGALERLDRLAEATPKGLDQAERAKRFEDLKRERARASISLGEFYIKVAKDHGPLAGEVASLDKIQAALPGDAALVAWVDIPPPGLNAADPDGEHWGVVVRSRGIPAWVPVNGTGPRGLWTAEDAGHVGKIRSELPRRPDAATPEVRTLIERLRAQRLDALAKALGATADGLPSARRLIILPSRALAGIPVEALLADGDTRTVSYAPSGTVLKYLRERPRPNAHAGLLALGDPVYDRPDESSDPKPQRKLQQLLVTVRGGDQNFSPLPGTRHEVEGLAPLFKAVGRPTRILLGSDASEPELDGLAASGDLGRFGFIHLAAHGLIDEDIPVRSAVILTQTGLPDPLDQALSHKPVFDGRLSVREIQRG